MALIITVTLQTVKHMSIGRDTIKQMFVIKQMYCSLGCEPVNHTVIIFTSFLYFLYNILCSM